MGTLYIDRKDIRISLDGNALAFYSSGKKDGIVPINPLKRVVIIGNVSIDTSVIHRLADGKINVVFLSGKRLRFRGALNGRLHNNGALRIAQYDKSRTDFALLTAKDIVMRKISKQRDLLDNKKMERPEIRLELTTAVNTLIDILNKLQQEDIQMDTLRGLEGAAGASYFSAYTELFAPSLEFNKRTRRPPLDPVNAMLSLCYTLLHFEMLREVEIIGLDPTIGFYHQFDYGRESLVCDLVEPYRPDVESFVYEIFRTRQFTQRDFSEDDERPGCYLKKASRQRFYPLYEEWAKVLRPLWREEVRDIARRIMDGADFISE
jgi:CRISPR-associated protein Cas1